LEAYDTLHGRRSLIESIDIPYNDTPAYFVTLQYSIEKDLNFTAIRNGANTNISLPECTLYDGSSYVGCMGCNVSSYTNYNVSS
jgi:hypothetical protein